MRKHLTILQTLSAACALLILPLVRAQGSSGDGVESFRVEILSTMLADEGIGEWGFAALVEVDGERILFDTGRYPDTVLRNAQELGVDLSNVTDVILSHHHMDHVGGLLTLRREFSKTNPSALSRVHVAHGIFFPRRWGSDATEEDNPMIAIREAYEATGGIFIEYDGPVELLPGAWLTGPVPRVHAERNWSGDGTIETPNGWEEDTIPESQSLIVNTSKGLAVVSGCGHAGIINIIDYACGAVADEPAFAVIGGFHLFNALDEHLQWTAERLNEAGVVYFLGAHCTGLEAVYQIRGRANLDRSTCLTGAVGATFDLSEGIDPGRIAR